jgi:hypothetical protein
MTRTEILQRLQMIRDKGAKALRLLESKPLSIETQAEIRRLAQWIKGHRQLNGTMLKRSTEQLIW